MYISDELAGHLEKHISLRDMIEGALFLGAR